MFDINLRDWYINKDIEQGIFLNSIADKNFNYKKIIDCTYPDIIIIYKNKQFVKLVNKRHCTSAKNNFKNKRKTINKNIKKLKKIMFDLKTYFINLKKKEDLLLIFKLLRFFDFYNRFIYYECDIKNELNNKAYKDIKNNDHYKYITPFLEKTSNLLKINKNDLLFLTISEVEKIIENKTNITNLEKQIKQRKKGFVYYIKANKETFSYDKNKINKIFSDLKKVNKHKSLKGVVTSKNKENFICGKVMVIKNKKELQKCKNKILCAKKINPDFFPYINEIKAIITEQGTKLSHASIFARENKIPCVVNVSDLFSNIKNKDYVEINLSKGIIKKL